MTEHVPYSLGFTVSKEWLEEEKKRKLKAKKLSYKFKKFINRFFRRK